VNPLIHASARAGRRAGLGVPLAAGLVLLAAATRLFGNGHDLDLLRCLAFLLGAALISAVDDPGREALAAVPFSLAARTLGRVGVAALAAVPIWIVALAIATRTTRDVPLFWMSVEGAGIAVFGLTCALLFHLWGRLDEPAVVAIPVALALLLAMQVLPRQWALLGDQTWGPSWIATRIRWAALIAIWIGLITHALVRDGYPRRDTGKRRRQRPNAASETPTMHSAKYGRQSSTAQAK